jgi:hypothetical protein
MVKQRRQRRPREPAPARDIDVDIQIQLAFRAPTEFIERLDRWRVKQIGPPSRGAAVRWIVDQYLKSMERNGQEARA